MRRFEHTQFGFRWGPVNVARIGSWKRRASDYGPIHVIDLSTAYRSIEVYVSPTGRSVRVLRDGVELKEPS